MPKSSTHGKRKDGRDGEVDRSLPKNKRGGNSPEEGELRPPKKETAISVAPVHKKSRKGTQPFRVGSLTICPLEVSVGALPRRATPIVESCRDVAVACGNGVMFTLTPVGFAIPEFISLFVIESSSSQAISPYCVMAV